MRYDTIPYLPMPVTLVQLDYCREETGLLRAKRYIFLRRIFHYLYTFHIHSHTTTLHDLALLDLEAQSSALVPDKIPQEIR